MTVSEEKATVGKEGMEEPVALPVAGKPKEAWGWTRRQRVGLGMLVCLLMVFLAVQYWRNPARVGDPVVELDGKSVMLPVRVDPNVASEEELSRIPHLGEKLAGRIVAYRELHRNEEGAAFGRVEDLRRVEGVGKAVVEQVRGYLKFAGEEQELAP